MASITRSRPQQGVPAEEIHRLATQRRSRFKRRFLIATVVVVLLVIFGCGGLFPALFQNETGLGPDTSNRMVSCDTTIDAASNIPGTRIGDLTEEQMGNATIIIEVGRRMDVPKWGWVVAIGTAMQESKLKNLPHLGPRNDYDSVGLFQQRPSQGWGTEAQIMDPTYSATKFYERLVKVPDWQNKSLTDAAQAVQRSAFPNAYQKWEQLSIDVVNEITKGDGELRGNPLCAVPGVVSASGWIVPAVGQVGSGFRTADRPDHYGVDVILPRGTAVRATAAGIVTTAMCNASNGNCDVDGSPAIRGCGWYVQITHAPNLMTRYCHFQKAPDVTVQQRVEAGEKIGEVGSSGNSSGPHLHFEVHVDGKAVDPEAFMSAHGAPLRT